MRIKYKVVHVDTEGGDFVAGGNGTYINNLMKCQEEQLRSEGDTRKLALITPAYIADGADFSINHHYRRLEIDANIYDRSGVERGIKLIYWVKPLTDTIDLYAIEPDKNHPDFFTTRANALGKIEQIRSIPERLMVEQESLKKRLSELSDDIYEHERNFFHAKSDIPSSHLMHYQALKKEYAEKKERLFDIFQGMRTNEVSLYMRNAHFHELAGKLIDYLIVHEADVDTLHSHDYGNVMQHVKSKTIASVNTFHSEPGKGLLPYYIHDQLGKEATQRGNGLALHHMVYTVSPEYGKWLVNPRNPNAHYTIPMNTRGRITHVTSIPNKKLHNLDSAYLYLQDYCTHERFKQLSVMQKKKLAKHALSKKIREINSNYDFDPEKVTILFLSRISRAKGSEFIEDTITYGKALGANVLICGYLEQHDPKFSEQLIQALKIKYPGIPFFIGKEEQSRIGNLHRAASDIGVGMSFEESFGLSYSECLCYGCHCVVTDVGGTRSAILNDPMCATLVPLYRGNNERYLDQQHKKYTLTNLRDERNLEPCGNSTAINAALEQLEYQYSAELLRETNKLRDKSDQTTGKIISLELPENNEAALQELQSLTKQQYQLNAQLDGLLGVNYLKTRAAFKTSIGKAFYRIKFTPEIAKTIHDRASKQFSESQWVKSINAVYNTASEMRASQRQLSSMFFRREKTCTALIQSDNQEHADNSTDEPLLERLRYSC